jgi:hypothetical protein
MIPLLLTEVIILLSSIDLTSEIFVEDFQVEVAYVGR